MIKNGLKMNDSKTEMIIFAPPRVKIPNLCIKVGTVAHQSADSVRNLGVIIDNNLAMDVHIKRECQLAYFQLRTIRTVQQVLSPDALERLVHAFVTARLDYCNSILYGIHEASISCYRIRQHARCQKPTRMNTSLPSLKPSAGYRYSNGLTSKSSSSHIKL